MLADIFSNMTNTTIPVVEVSIWGGESLIRPSVRLLFAKQLSSSNTFCVLLLFESQREADQLRNGKLNQQRKGR